MSQSTEFKIIYDGEALQKHSMEVRDLAPALLALGNLFDEANRILNGDKATIKLQVKAHEAGSFEIHLVLFQSLADQISHFLSGDYITSIINLKELICGVLAGGSNGLFWLIKKFRGKNPSKITDLKNGLMRIEIGNEAFDIPLALLRMYQDLTIRRAVESVVRPLHKDGINLFKIKDQNQVVETINKDEVDYFTVPEVPEEEIVSSESEAAYSIVSLTFKDDNKWRLSDGNNIINAIIRDDNFKQKVNENSISFSKGDILRCRIRTTQWRTISGLKTEHEVLEVKEYIPAAKQALLFEV